MPFRNRLRTLFRRAAQTQPPPAPRPYDIFVFPVVNWDFLFQRPQHLALEFARRGHRVFYLMVDFHPDTFSVAPQVREITPGVFEVMLPGSFDPPDIYTGIPTELQVAVMEAGLRQLRERYSIGTVLSIVDYPFWAPVVRELTNNFVLYDCMDDYASFANSGPPARELERDIVRDADLVVCSSKHLREKLLRKYGREPLLIRNGVEASHYTTPPAELALRPDGRTAGYWGATAEWTDIELLIHAARELPDVRFVLLGDVMRVDVTELAALPNVRLVGRVPYEQLPAWLHAFDVCLLPYRICEYALASDPMKVWEYMSAGKPVVAVRFPEVERLDRLITLTSTREEFVDGIRRGLAERDQAIAEARRAFARENTWSRRCDEMREAVAPFFPKVSVIVLAHNQVEFTGAALLSLDQFSHYQNLEIVVVDNGSTDDTPRFLERWAAAHPRGKVVRSGVNLGFSAGNNLGARNATGDYLVFINNDCFVTDGWIGDLLAHFRRNPRLGLLGPVTNRSGNESVIDIQYDDMSQMAIRARRYTRSHRGQVTHPHVLHWFCVILPRSVWRQVGELDENFGLGMFEDDDYTLRVRAAGYETACAEDVFIHHHHSASFGLLPQAEYDALFARNRQYFESKWGPWVAPVFRKELQAKCSP